MSSIRIALSILIICSLAASASAALFLSQEALEQGEVLGRDPFFDNVGGAVELFEDGSGLFYGSAVLIAPDWVLTAGHVATDTGTILHDNLQITFQDNLNDGDVSGVAVNAIFLGDGYSERFPPGIGNDIALMRLAEPILNIEPAIRFRGEDQIGTRIRAAGYGAPGIWPDEGLFDGVKRAGENVIEQFGLAGFDPQFAILEFDRFSNRLPQEWTGSQFDSGGGWFNDNDELVAITNFGASQAFFTGGIRISLYNDWIDATIAANSVPEPTSFLLLASAVVVATAERRRRCC